VYVGCYFITFADRLHLVLFKKIPVSSQLIKGLEGSFFVDAIVLPLACFLMTGFHCLLIYVLNLLFPLGH
jgi:hypothetical protein